MDVRDAVEPSPVERCTRFQPPARWSNEGVWFEDRGVNSTGRLDAELRSFARRADPLASLTEAAVRYALERANRAARGALGVFGNKAPAFADLAVTGRRAHAAFTRRPPRPADLLPRVRAELSARLATHRLPSIGEADLAAAVDEALDRAYAVLWAIRGPTAHRLAARSALRWIAVSAEDDDVHRPVNVASAPYPQHEMALPLTFRDPDAASDAPGTTITVRARFMIASASAPAPAAVPFDPRGLPPEEPIVIPPGEEIVLFVHGHSSRLEECLSLIGPLQAAGRRHGKSYCIIAVDLPGAGYTERFDPGRLPDPRFERVNPRDAAVGPVTFPVLEMVEQALIGLLHRIHERVPVLDRVAAIIGGSLGGNTTLRLGERADAGSRPYLRRLVSWSPASVWESTYAGDPARRQSHRRTNDRMRAPETHERRAEYFFQSFTETTNITVIRVLEPQPYYWYRNDWEPCKSYSIAETRREREELYSDYFRRWHWRYAHEQLIFSHQYPAAGPAPIDRFTGDLLLLAGDQDNHAGTHIYSRARELAERLRRVNGRALFVRSTGHSIQSERPVFLANEIAQFLNPPSFLVQASWMHGHKLKVEDGDRARATRMGFHGRVRATAGGDNWVHFAIPTPVILDGRRSKLGSVLLRFRASGGARVHAVHIYDGEGRLAAHDNLEHAPAAWATERFELPNRPEVNWGLGISVGVRLPGPDSWIDFASAGADFLL